MSDPITEDIIASRETTAVELVQPASQIDAASAVTVANTAGMRFIADIDKWWMLAKYLHMSGMFRKKYKDEAQITAILLYAEELGIGPLHAMRNVAFFDGNFVMSADLMLGLAHERGGVTWAVTLSDAEACEMVFSREGFPDLTVSWTIEEAGAAGLLGKGNWRSHPADMLNARCRARGARRIAPDILAGVYSTEEMEGESFGPPNVADPETERLNRLLEAGTEAVANADTREERTELMAQLEESLAT